MLLCRYERCCYNLSNFIGNPLLYKIKQEDGLRRPNFLLYYYTEKLGDGLQNRHFCNDFGNRAAKGCKSTTATLE